MLEQLGYDLLVEHVFPNLSAEDIVAVSMCCKQLNSTVTQIVWRSQYRATFDRNSKIDHLEGDWEQNYSRRMKSSIYFWGKNLFDGSTVPRNIPRNNHYGLCMPWKFPGQKRTRQISFGGFGLWMLDFDGNVWLSGAGGPSAAYFYGRDPKCITESISDRIDYISAGRSHLVALSGDKVITFGPGFHLSQEPSVLDIPDNIVSISAGWEATAAISASRGVIVWKNIIQKPEQVSIVQGTQNQSGQVAVGAGFALFLDDLRQLYFIELGDDFKLVPKRILVDENPVFIRANYIRFAVICTSKRAYIGTFEDGEIKLVKVPNAETIDFCDIALGDHHNLGLSKQGSLYSWGRESRKCGSLGLGPEQKVVEAGGTVVPVQFGGDLNVEKPTKIDLDSVLSIAAGGWQSAAIAADSANEPTRCTMMR